MVKTKRKQLNNKKNAVFIDVDGTLLLWKSRDRAKINHALLNRIKEGLGDGVEFVLWSRRGRIYAEKMANHFEVADLFCAIIGKPTAIIDDEGLNWLKGVQVNPKREEEGGQDED